MKNEVSDVEQLADTAENFREFHIADSKTLTAVLWYERNHRTARAVGTSRRAEEDPTALRRAEFVLIAFPPANVHHNRTRRNGIQTDNNRVHFLFSLRACVIPP